MVPLLALAFGFGFTTAIALVAAAHWLESNAGGDPVATLADAMLDASARTTRRLDAIERRLHAVEEAGLGRDGLNEPSEAYAAPG